MEELEPTPPEVKRYQRQKLTAGIAALAVSFCVLALASFSFGPAIDRIVRDWFGTNVWLRLLVLALLYGGLLEWLTLPFDFYSGYILEHRYELSTQTLAGWLWKKLKAYLVGGPIALALLFGVYSLLWFAGSWWWVWAATGWLLFAVLLARVAPVLILPLFYKVTPLDDPELRGRLQRLAERAGLDIEGVYRLHLSEETKKANAALAGLGKSRRVLLGDTLLDQFSPEEIDVVFAHEVGHHYYRHIPKLISVNTVTAFVFFWLADVLLRSLSTWLGYAAFNDPGALPLLMLIGMSFSLVLMPMGNALSRHFERQCDRFALEQTSNPSAYRSAFIKLAKTNKADADPNRVLVWLFHDHPPIRERLALAGDGSSKED
ncbi:MAG: hypothetical protein KatS3mg105_4196 [Gemmatales bacterium]|nr:MAG: hypothetical protein KatS3mg105_4196 [Gemmatales bacterium]